MKVSSSTKLYAVIGDPIEHSLSPIMHNVAFQLLDLNNIYLAFRVKPTDLGTAVAGIRSLGILGFNVTIPHKVSIMEHLDEIDRSATRIGAVNTVVKRDGALVGYNTDGAGALASLREASVGLEGAKIVLLGAGGAARALGFSIAPLAGNLVVLNRTESRAKDLAFALKEFGNVEGKKLSEDTLCVELRDADVLINSTSAGMHPQSNETPVERKFLHERMIVFDIVYNPLSTRLLREAKTAGAYVVGGIRMLVYQGALAFELWTGRKPPVKEMCTAVENALGGK